MTHSDTRATIAPSLPYGLVVNPRAALGRGKRVAVQVKRALESAGINTITLSGANAEACAAAVTSAARAGLSGLVLVGGDGLLGLVLQIAEARQLPIGVIPAGSGNDFARQFAMPKRPRAAVARILEAVGQPRLVDLGVVSFPAPGVAVAPDAGAGAGAGTGVHAGAGAGAGTGVHAGAGVPGVEPGSAIVAGSDVTQTVQERWFAGGLSVGLDAAVNRRANAFRLPLGPLRYHLALIAEIALLPKRSFSVSFTPAQTAAGEQPRPYTRGFGGLLTSVMNISAIGGGIPLAPRAVPTDGMLDLVEVTYGSKRRLFSVLGVLAQGKHERLPEVTITRVSEATIGAHASGAAEIAYADGERVGSGPFSVRVMPGAMQLLA